MLSAEIWLKRIRDLLAGGITVGNTILQIPTIETDIYASGDNVGGLIEFEKAARSEGGGGKIITMVITDKGREDAELELWLFDRIFTPGEDNDPWGVSDDDLENLVCILTTDDGVWFDAANNSAAIVVAAHRYEVVDTTLYGRLVTRSTPTYGTETDLTVKIGLVQD